MVIRVCGKRYNTPKGIDIILTLAYRAAVTVTKEMTIANIYEHLLSARDVFSPSILCGTTLGGTNYPDTGGN